MKTGSFTFLLGSTLAVLINTSAFSSNIDLGIIEALPHKNATLDIDKSMLATNTDYTINCQLALEETETAIMPFSMGSGHISIFINGYKWPPFTRYEVNAMEAINIVFTHINTGSKIKVGVQNLDPFDLMKLHCFATDNH